MSEHATEKSARMKRYAKIAGIVVAFVLIDAVTFYTWHVSKEKSQATTAQQIDDAAADAKVGVEKQITPDEGKDEPANKVQLSPQAMKLAGVEVQPAGSG